MVPPTVTDLFCGAGGFSWGFYMAGFKPIYALDSWDIACSSYKANMRKAQVVCRDALTVDPSEIPDSDVIIGGPPCQAFSTANMRHVFQESDLDLIRWFLRVVEVKKPKHWIMENVPPVAKYLRGGFMKRMVRMSDYGVPQLRRRCLSGIYVMPRKTPCDVKFPAICATEYKLSPGNRQHTKLSNVFGRIALIPEALMVQTFPLDYQLVGTLKQKYIQVGNAVPPLMAYRLAEAIRKPSKCITDYQEAEP